MSKIHQKTLFGFIVLVTLTLQGCGVNPSSSDTNSVQTQEEQQIPSTNIQGNTETSGTTQQDTTSTTTGSSVQAVLNGTFHLTSTYASPAGPEPLDATVTLKDDVITAVEVKNVAHATISKNFQDKFSSGIAGQIVGKNIKDVQITYVNGSSLTAKAFNEALHSLEK